MWPVLANQLGRSRAAQKRLDKSSDVSNARLATLALTDKKTHLRDMMPPPWGPQPKLKEGWLKRIAARNNMQKFFLRAQ